MLGQYLLENLSLFITGLVSGVLGYIFNRLKNRAELKSLQADAAQKVVDLYQEALDDLKVRYEEKFIAARDEYDQRTINLIKNSEERHQQLEKKIDHLQKEHDNWKKRYVTLKKEFDDYMEKHKI